jgi:hypothetical protein
MLVILPSVFVVCCYVTAIDQLAASYYSDQFAVCGSLQWRRTATQSRTNSSSAWQRPAWSCDNDVPCILIAGTHNPPRLTADLSPTRVCQDIRSDKKKSGIGPCILLRKTLVCIRLCLSATNSEQMFIYSCKK